MSYNKIFFHLGVQGNPTGIGDCMRQLDAEGIPFFIKSADSAGPLLEGQLLAKASGVDHTLVYRRAGKREEGFDVPVYHLSPAVAAHAHWRKHIAEWPPELNPSVVWMETVNEVDKGRAEWLAEFAIHTAQLALAAGRRWAAFGWSSGEPERPHWQGPKMLAFLRLVADHPDQLAIALHEYSYTDQLMDGYPDKVGRFQALFEICDQNGIRRPTILITEFGWTYNDVPDPTEAINQLAVAAAMYAGFPEVRGAAIWNLGGSDGRLANRTQRLIEPVTRFTLSIVFPDGPPGPNLVPFDNTPLAVVPRALNVRNRPVISLSTLVGRIPQGFVIVPEERREIDGNIWVRSGSGWCAQLHDGSTYLRPSE